MNGSWRVSALCLAVALGLGVAAVTPVRADPSSLVGAAAPPVRARPLDSDREIDLTSYRGRVVLVAFVATWCRACRRIAPALDGLVDRWGERGLAVLAMSHEPRARLRAHAAGQPRRFPLLQCTGRTAVQWGADGLPTLVLVDRDGVVRFAHQGATGEVVSRLRAAVASLL